MRNLQWNEGAPEKYQPGMLIDIGGYGGILLLGSILADCEGFREHTSRWAWLIQPYQLEWLQSMAKAHRIKSRGE